MVPKVLSPKQIAKIYLAMATVKYKNGDDWAGSMAAMVGMAFADPERFTEFAHNWARDAVSNAVAIFDDDEDKAWHLLEVFGIDAEDEDGDALAGFRDEDLIVV